MTQLQINCKALKDGFKYRGLDWTDGTSYSRENKDRIPTMFVATTNSYRLTVTCGHTNYKPDWIFHCYELGFDTKYLGTYDDPKEAIDSALTFCHSRLSTLFHSFEPTR